MSEETVDGLLKTIRASAESAEESVRKLINDINNDDKGKIPSFLETASNDKTIGGVSLLSLKNNSLLSYVNSVALLMLHKVDEVKNVLEDDSNESGKKTKDYAINNTITQRVVLERGVKGLEKKIQYQLDKLVRSYNRSLDNEKKKQQSGVIAKERKAENSEEEQEDEDEEDSDADLNFKPNAFALTAKTKGEKNNKDEGKDGEKYRPPKISAVAPPVSRPLRSENEGKSSNRRRKLQSMEEYIREHGDAPSVGYSIGSNILDHGRGGIKTTRDKEKEDNVTRYEEENFTRLPTAATKKTAKEKRKQEENIFGGEDFSMFGTNRSYESSSRKKRPASAWDRAKRRRT